MALFELALAWALHAEAGYVWDKNDHGGPTNRGVTLATLAAYRGTTVTAEDVKNLTLDETTAIYAKLYWRPIKGDAIELQPVAIALFDMAVLCGPAQATKMAQAAVATATPGIKADGLMGPMTLSAINAMPALAFLLAFRKQCNAFLEGRAKADATQNRFLAGWETRTGRFATLA